MQNNGKEATSRFAYVSCRSRVFIFILFFPFRAVFYPRTKKHVDNLTYSTWQTTVFRSHITSSISNRKNQKMKILNDVWQRFTTFQTIKNRWRWYTTLTFGVIHNVYTYTHTILINNSEVHFSLFFITFDLMWNWSQS